MKSKFARRLSVMLLCLLLAFAMLLSACTPADPTPPEPDDQEKPGDTTPPDDGKEPDDGKNPDDGKEDPPVDDGFVKLSDKGNALYNATYQTMLDRLMQDGYAQTSLTGAYDGMFVRDASIQVMAHIAQGDMDAAMRILKYMAAYHKALGAEHAIHIMNSLNDDELYDYVTGQKTAPKLFAGTSGQSVAQLDYGTALYRVVLPNNQAAQEFSVPFDSITEISIALEISSKSGKIHLDIGTAPGDASVADMAFDVKDVVIDGKWAKFVFDTPVKVEPNQVYTFTVGGEVSDGNVVAFGKLGAGGAYNFDLPAYGGWIKEAHSIGYQIRSDVSIAGESNAASQTFTATGDRLDKIDIALTSNEATKAHAKLTDASGKVIKEVTVDVPENTNILTLDMGLTVTEGAQYTLSVWTDGGRTAWEMMSADSHYLIVTPEYSGSHLAGSATIGGSTVASQTLPAILNSKKVTSAALYLAAVGTVGANDTFTVSLYKGDVLVDAITCPLSMLGDKATEYKFELCLPVSDVPADDDYSIKVSASREGSVKWFGKQDGSNVLLSYTVGCSNVTPLSRAVQVDGHYMWLNSFAMFVLQAEKNFKGQYDEFIKAVYPQMSAYAEHFFETEGTLGGNVGFIDETYGLMYTPSYEHSRDGRYWKAFDLITNVFVSEAMHKMSQVASVYGTADQATAYAKYADELAAAINDKMVYELDGKDIYIDLIDVENGTNHKGYTEVTEEGYRVYKGFSFVNLAPLAADWYAMDEQIMKNTYETYFKFGSEKYGKYNVLGVTVTLNENETTDKIGNHVIGKGFAWELHYNWKMGNTERVEEMIAFMEARSTTVYPEVWRRDGGVSDSANQEHANWILFTMARITGKYQPDAEK